MNTQDSYTITFDSGATQSLMNLSRGLGLSPSDTIAKALVLLGKVKGKTIIVNEENKTVSVDITKFIKLNTSLP